MNTEETNIIQRINKKSLSISLVLFLLEIVLFILIKLNIFESMDSSIAKALQPDKIENDEIPTLIKIVYYLNRIYIPYIIIIIVNNFSNVYNTFILFNILSIICYISCILKFIFYKFIPPNDGMIYYCGEGWNLPSTEMMISVFFYLALWNILFFNKNNNNNYNSKDSIKYLKYIFLGAIIIFNIINLFFLAKIGYYLFSHLVFSAILGVSLYLFIFEANILKKKFNPKKFCFFINKKFECYILFKIILLAITFLPYILERNASDQTSEQCSSIEGSFFYKNKSPHVTYVDDTFALMSVFFGHFFVSIGLKCELGFLFGNDLQNFEQYHFGVNIDDLNTEREFKNNTGTIIVTRETEWNNTSMTKSIIRLIVTFILSIITFLPYIIIKRGDNYDYTTIFLVKYFLSFALFSFGITFIFKGIFRIMKLSNEILGSILIDQ